MSIGEIILERRKELKMTQKELAEKLNVTDKTVSRWECGVNLPDVAMLKSIATVLDVNITYFYEDVQPTEINETEEYDYDMIRKFKKAVTDSEAEVRYAPGKDGVNNLMTIYRAFTGKSYEEIERDFAGKGYGEFKLAVGEACADGLAPVRAEFDRLMADKAFLESVMKNGAEEAAYYARKTMSKVRRKIGFVN